MTKNEFVEAIAKAVQKIAPEFNILVYSPVIAQAILESGWGTSNKAKYNNFFGLKYREGRVTCHNGTFVDGSQEQNPDGSYVPITDQWYSFATLEDGVRGYFQFINTSRYSNLKNVTDWEKYIELIREDGYATSLSYVENIKNVVKNNNLTKYDKKEDKQMTNFKVHLDAGHYGKYNQSPVVKSYYESEMNWKLVNYLEQELTKRGITVTKSRTDINKDKGLYDRGYGAKGCNLFLSIHSNACGNCDVDYPVVYRGYDKAVADEFGLKLAKLIQNLMGTTQGGRTATRKGTDGGEYYGVLRGARAAGLTYYYIIEHSFHTNKKAAEWLLNDNNIKELAKQEAELIASYFNVEKQGEKKEEVKEEPKEEKPVGTKYYRVRKSWKDAKSQLGAYTNLNNAKKACKNGYFVYDWNGKQVYPEIKKEEPKKETNVVNTYLPGVYRVICDSLNIRKGPGTNYFITGSIKDKGTYTIVEVKNGNWGKLKSGAGWINIHKNYCTKVNSASSTTTSKPAVTTTKKTNEQIAKEVIAGKWGNGTQRKAKLEAAGYNYTIIQALVNKLCK
jgi:N-acetylmuramoyl-L-alanine amidase